jgi:hypothetical protein
MSGKEIEVTDNPEAGQFEASSGGETAVAQYRLQDGAMLFSHTLVPESMEGRGVGTSLVKAGLAAARERGLKVIPACSFFARYIAEHPEEQDLVDDGGWAA